MAEKPLDLKELSLLSITPEIYLLYKEKHKNNPDLDKILDRGILSWINKHPEDARDLKDEFNKAGSPLAFVQNYIRQNPPAKKPGNLTDQPANAAQQKAIDFLKANGGDPQQAAAPKPGAPGGEAPATLLMAPVLFADPRSPEDLQKELVLMAEKGTARQAVEALTLARMLADSLALAIKALQILAGKYGASGDQEERKFLLRGMAGLSDEEQRKKMGDVFEKMAAKETDAQRRAEILYLAGIKRERPEQMGEAARRAQFSDSMRMTIDNRPRSAPPNVTAIPTHQAHA